MRLKLYAIPGSNSAMAARLMLAHKGVAHETVELPPAIHALVVRTLGFPQPTVPGLKIDGRRVQNTRSIARVLDELFPEPPLFPADPELRRAVEEAEAWGEEILQPIPRRLLWCSFRRDTATFSTFAEGASLNRALRLAAQPSARLLTWLATQRHEASDETVRNDLAKLPALLDTIDGWIEAGVLGGETLNAADFQIAASTRMLLVFEDVAPLVAGRPAEAHARRVAPVFPGRMPRVLPADWLPIPYARA